MLVEEYRVNVWQDLGNLYLKGNLCKNSGFEQVKTKFKMGELAQTLLKEDVSYDIK